MAQIIFVYKNNIYPFQKFPFLINLPTLEARLLGELRLIFLSDMKTRYCHSLKAVYKLLLFVLK